MQRLHTTISGKVQMVGFRAFAQRRAVELGLTGYAHNMDDGAVEVVAEGLRDKLEAFLRALRRGPSAARVESVDYYWTEADGTFASFRIGY